MVDLSNIKHKHLSLSERIEIKSDLNNNQSIRSKNINFFINLNHTAHLLKTYGNKSFFINLREHNNYFLSLKEW